MMQTFGLNLEIDSTETSKLYKRKLEQTNGPVFTMKEVITGRCVITAVGNEKIRHKGIYAVLLGRYFVSGQQVKEITVKKIQILQQGEISPGTSVDFTFKDHGVQFPSYYGADIQLQYFILVGVTRLLRSDVTLIQSIGFIDPMLHVPPSAPTTMTMIYNDIIFDLYSSKSKFSVYEKVKGYILFGDNEMKGLKSVNLYVVLEEKFVGQSPAFSSSTILMKYQLIDGSPRPSTKMPFVIQLAPLKLWEIKKESQIETTYRFELHTLTHNGETKIDSVGFDIYL